MVEEELTSISGREKEIYSSIYFPLFVGPVSFTLVRSTKRENMGIWNWLLGYCRKYSLWRTIVVCKIISNLKGGVGKTGETSSRALEFESMQTKKICPFLTEHRSAARVRNPPAALLKALSKILYTLRGTLMLLTQHTRYRGTTL